MTRPRAPWTPPPRDGVSASRVAVSQGPWPTLLAFLSARMPHVGDWRERLLQGGVLDASGQPLTADAAALPGSVLWYWRQPPPEPRVPFELEVLHQDEHLVVVDKPHFLSVTPGGRHLQETVLVRLKRLLGLDTLVPVHRLDRETAGVLLFTAQPQARAAYHALLRGRQLHKVYEAVAPWRSDLAWPHLHSSRLQAQEGPGFMQMQTLPGAPNAHTRIGLIQRLGQPLGPDVGELAHYRLWPLTGRKHQLRVHLCDLGMPIVGDRIYPVLWPDIEPGAAPDYTQPLQLLAREVSFTDPLGGRELRFASRRQLRWAEPQLLVDAKTP